MEHQAFHDFGFARENHPLAIFEMDAVFQDGPQKRRLVFRRTIVPEQDFGEKLYLVTLFLALDQLPEFLDSHVAFQLVANVTAVLEQPFKVVP